MNTNECTATTNEGGFTLIEMVVAIIILTVAVLGTAASTGQVMQAASSASVKAEALQAVEGRISIIQMDPRYTKLDSIYEGEESDLPGLDGYTRKTSISHTQIEGESERLIDYKTIMVTVSGPGLNTITRTIVLGAP